MGDHVTRDPRRRLRRLTTWLLVPCALLFLAVLVGQNLLAPGAEDPTVARTAGGAPAADAAATAGDESLPGPGPGPATSAPRRERPVRIDIPAISVDAPMTQLGIAADGTTEVPSDPDDVGWIDTTPAPGQQGPAVLAGHVDSTTGQAVFQRLGELAPGDEVLVTRRDGTTVRFTVNGVRTYAQDDFPTEQVYGPVPGPVLRLITCGGTYDKANGGYQSNVVVYAS